jgi:hypothetical protein
MDNNFDEIFDKLEKQKKTINELVSLSSSLKTSTDESDKKILINQIDSLTDFFKKSNDDIQKNINKINIPKKIEAKAPLKDESAPIKKAISPPVAKVQPPVEA